MAIEQDILNLQKIVKVLEKELAHVTKRVTATERENIKLKKEINSLHQQIDQVSYSVRNNG